MTFESYCRVKYFKHGWIKKGVVWHWTEDMGTLWHE